MSDVYTKYDPGYEPPERDDVSRPDPADRLINEKLGAKTDLELVETVIRKDAA